MKQNTKKWILLLTYILTFPIGLQVSFIIKNYIRMPLNDLIHRTSQYFQMMTVYVIFVSIISGIFIIFMIFFSRKIANSFSPGTLLPIGIVIVNILCGIPMATMRFSSISYYYNKYDTRQFYIALCFLLVFLIADKKLYTKNNTHN